MVERHREMTDTSYTYSVSPSGTSKLKGSLTPDPARAVRHRAARRIRRCDGTYSLGVLRPTSGRVRADPQLLPDREAALPDRRVWSAVRAGARVLGTRRQPGGYMDTIKYVSK